MFAKHFCNNKMKELHYKERINEAAFSNLSPTMTLLCTVWQDEEWQIIVATDTDTDPIVCGLQQNEWRQTLWTVQQNEERERN